MSQTIKKTESRKQKLIKNAKRIYQTINPSMDCTAALYMVWTLLVLYQLNNLSGM